MRKLEARLLGIYFSGTGNTKYCLERFLNYYDGSQPVSIESPNAIEAIRKSQNIVFGYPIYYSNIPKIVRDYIYQNRVDLLKQGKPTKDGLNFFCHLAGLFGQRLWFYRKTKDYTNKLKINKSKCIGCGKCVTLCPMSNLSISKQKAITLLGEEVVEQSLIENYL